MANDRASGDRIRHLEKERQTQKIRIEQKREQIEQDHKTMAFKEKFGKSHVDMMESEFRKDTVGLKTKEDFRNVRENLEKKEGILRELMIEKHISSLEQQDEERRKNRKSKVATTKLSFTMDEEGEEGGGGEEGDAAEGGDERGGAAADAPSQGAPKKSKFIKNPSVDTSFLPDRDRERNELRERERLMQAFHAEQERKQARTLEIDINFWDGSSHHRTVRCKQGTSVGRLMGIVAQALSDEFKEMKTLPSDNLLLCKQDVLIPHDLTLHMLIEKRAYGSKGTVFDLERHTDVRVIGEDGRVEPQQQSGEAAAAAAAAPVAVAKVVERKWFERNKHIFPMNKWETFDPLKVHEGAP